MEVLDLSRATRVGQSAAALLAKPETIHLLDAVALETLTAGEIAARLSVPLKRLWYRLSRLTAAGILVVAGERKRAGRPERLYRCAAESFFVPAELRRSTIGSELALRLRSALDSAHPSAGELVAWSGTRFRVRKIPDRTAPLRRSIELWARASIRPKDFALLESEMRALLDNFSAKTVGGRQRFLIHFAVAPADLI